MELLLVGLLLAAAVAVIAWPLWSGRSVEADSSPDVAELEAAKEAKYREIRDTELDFRTGKLSPSDYRAIDDALRAEAVELLRRLDRARERGS